MLGGFTARPLVCVTIAFGLGIAAAGSPGLAWVVLAAGAGGLGWAVVRRRRLLPRIAVVALAALAGGFLSCAHQRPGATDVSTLPPGGQTLVGTVANAPRYARGTWSFVLTAEQHLTADRAEPITGRCYVHFHTDAPIRRGDRWQLTGRLRLLTGARNPGGRSERQRLSGLGVGSVLSVGGKSLAQPLGEGDLGWIPRHAYAAQRQALAVLERFVRAPYPELTAGIAASVIFGVHAYPPPAEVSESFRRAGTIHLLVVSGAMISSVFGLVFLPGFLGATWRRAWLERQSGWPASGRGRISHRPGVWAAVIAVLLSTYYAVLTEGGQAVARAAIMGVLIGLAFALRRLPRVAKHHGLKLDYYTLLGAAALLILIAQPPALFQPGFQISFAAVWALIYFVPKVDPFLRSLPRVVRQPLVGTLAAQVVIFPILAWHFGNAPVAGLAANLLAIPLAGVVLMAGMATCALGLTLPWLAPVAGWITGWAARGLMWVSSAFAAAPWAAPEVPRPHLLLIIAWYAGLVLAGWWLVRRRPAAAERAPPA